MNKRNFLTWFSGLLLALPVAAQAATHSLGEIPMQEVPLNWHSTAGSYYAAGLLHWAAQSPEALARYRDRIIGKAVLLPEELAALAVVLDLPKRTDEPDRLYSPLGIEMLRQSAGQIAKIDRGQMAEIHAKHEAAFLSQKMYPIERNVAA